MLLTQALVTHQATGDAYNSFFFEEQGSETLLSETRGEAQATKTMASEDVDETSP